MERSAIRGPFFLKKQSYVSRIIFNRRRFLGAAALTLAAHEIALAGFSAPKSNLIFPANADGLKQEADNSV